MGRKLRQSDGNNEIEQRRQRDEGDEIIQICFHFDFTDASKNNARENEIKRQTLLALVDFIQSGSSKIISESCQEEMIKMVSLNLLQCLPPASHENTGQEPADPEEEEPYLEPSWPHIQFFYELLLRYVVSTDTDTKLAKRYIDHSFVLKLLELFDAEDPREREYLKTILHRIYGKFMVHRPFIRKAINNIFNRGLLKYWPVTNCTKENLFLGELEEVVEATQPVEFPRCMVPLFQQIARCLNSSHFQI
ncbi:hypothetical protein Bca52824_014929 [Brassica carinata]|uniref:Uncharacterized protein n=1 Tax=Brassica carinata TaxID=52824 RepID=A0A8X7W2A0_BRACI|nr:hypothetical protein Bca52824_014929 [Brassica carinata]